MRLQTPNIEPDTVNALVDVSLVADELEGYAETLRQAGETLNNPKTVILAENCRYMGTRLDRIVGRLRDLLKDPK